MVLRGRKFKWKYWPDEGLDRCWWLLEKHGGACTYGATKTEALAKMEDYLAAFDERMGRENT